MVTIIIPVYNEERYLGACLESIARGTYHPNKLEVLVVDGASEDRTRDVALSFERHFNRLVVIHNPDRLKPISLNMGIRQASADVIMRLDAHAQYDPLYIENSVRHLLDGSAENVGGIRETARGTGALSVGIGESISHPFAAGDAQYRTGAGTGQPRYVDTVFCGCYRREVFERIGLFNEQLVRAQDREFNARLRAAGGRILLDPSVRCTYYPRQKLLDYLRWNVQGAFWLFYSRRFTRTRMLSWRNLVPVAFVLWHLFFAIVLLMSEPLLAVLLGAPILVYLAISIGVSFNIALRNRRPTLLLIMPLLFAITHYGYGCGALAGISAALFRRRKIWNSTESPNLSSTADALR